MKISCFLLFAFITIVSNAQDKAIKNLQDAGQKKIKSLDSNGWKKTGTVLLSINQGALSNWVAGGEENVIGVNGIFNYAINYKMDKNVWDNYFDIALGFQNATSFKKFRKIDDRVDITSKYGRQIGGNWYWGILFNFNSQLLAGYDYSTNPATKISSFLSPGKILLSPGVEYSPNGSFSVYASPITIRWLLKLDEDFLNEKKFGVDSAKRVYSELGAYVTIKYTADITSWAKYTGRLDLFSNYRRNPQNIDLLMNNLLTMKFTNILAANISVDILYDDDILKRLQLKEIFGIGLTLNL